MVRCKITKGFEPSRMEVVKALLLIDSGVKGISIVDEVLEMFKG